jgi:electron transfer flavoprotein beta subunit
MKIVVLVKSVPDTAAMPEIAPDGKSVLTSEQNCIMNPYDEYALEEALRLRDGGGAEVIAVSLGGDSSMKILRTALAAGADKAVLIREERGAQWTGRTTARVLAAAMERLQPDLILAGKQAVDDDGAQVAERIAQQLDWVHASAVSRLRIEADQVVADREVEEGRYALEFNLPALLTVEKGINTPRYPTLPNLLKAKSKPVHEFSISDLGLSLEDLKPRISVERLIAARQERRKMILEGDAAFTAKKLVALLSEEQIETNIKEGKNASR